MADQTLRPHQTPPTEQLDPRVPLSHEVPPYLQLLIDYDEQKGITITQAKAPKARQVQYSSVSSLQVLTSALVGLMRQLPQLYPQISLGEVLAQVQNRLDYETFPPEDADPTPSPTPTPGS